MSLAKEARELVRKFEREGYDVSLNGRGHYEVTDPNEGGKRVLTFSATPSDRHFKQAVEADVKRYGLFGKNRKENDMATIAQEAPKGAPLDSIARSRAHRQRVEQAKALYVGVIGAIGEGGQTRFAEKMVELSGDDPPGNTAAAVTTLYEFNKNDRASENALNQIEKTALWFVENPNGIAEAEKTSREKQEDWRKADTPMTKPEKKEEPVDGRVNSKAEGYDCDVCGKHFDTKQALGGHRSGAHSKEKCKVCGKEISSGFPMNSHMKTHEQKVEKIVEPPRPSVEIERKLRDDLNEAINKVGFTNVALISMEEAGRAGMRRISANLDSAHSSMRRILKGEPCDMWVMDQFRLGVNKILSMDTPPVITPPVEEVPMEDVAPRGKDGIDDPVEHPIEKLIADALTLYQVLVTQGVEQETAMAAVQQVTNKKLR